MLGPAIRQARTEKGMSQERLAEALGVSRQAVSKWEMGQSVPTLRNLEGIEAALDLPAGTLAELLQAEACEPSSCQMISKKRGYILGAAGVLVLALAFFLGRATAPSAGLSAGNGQITMAFQSPMGPADVAVTVPVQKDGTVLFDMPLSIPGEETRLARQLEFYQWPACMDLEQTDLPDFDLNPPWGPAENYLSGDWKIESQIQMDDHCSLALVCTEEPLDGATCWFLSRDDRADGWQVLYRCAEDGLVRNEDGSWAAFAGNVLGYPSFVARCGGDDDAVFFAVSGTN